MSQKKSIIDNTRRTEHLIQLVKSNPSTLEELSSTDVLLVSAYVLLKSPEFRSSEEIFILSKCTENIKFFKDIRSVQGGVVIHEQCCKYMILKFCPQDFILFSQNQKGDIFYIILQGEVKVMTNGKSIDPETNIEVYGPIERIRLKTGSSFGELALQNDEPRKAGVTTTENTYFATLDKENYCKILKNANNKNQYMEIFQQIKIIKDLPIIYIKNLYDLSNEMIVKYGKYVYLEGDEINFIYLIKSGDFQIKKNILLNEQKKQEEQPVFTVKSPQKQIWKEVILNIISQGEYFGEEEIFLKHEYDKRQYSVQCVCDNSVIYSINKREFMKRFNNNDDLVQNILHKIRQKQQQRIKRIELYRNDEITKNVYQNKANIVQNFNLYDEKNNKIPSITEQPNEEKSKRKIKRVQKLKIEEIVKGKTLKGIQLQDQVMQQFYDKYNIPKEYTSRASFKTNTTSSERFSSIKNKTMRSNNTSIMTKNNRKIKEYCFNRQQSIQKERSEFENLMLNSIQNVSLTNRCDTNDNNSVQYFKEDDVKDVKLYNTNQIQKQEKNSAGPFIQKTSEGRCTGNLRNNQESYKFLRNQYNYNSLSQIYTQEQTEYMYLQGMIQKNTNYNNKQSQSSFDNNMLKSQGNSQWYEKNDLLPLKYRVNEFNIKKQQSQQLIGNFSQTQNKWKSDFQEQKTLPSFSQNRKLI